MSLEKPERRVSLVTQLIQQIKDLITSSEWPVGMKIPTELEIVQVTGTSRSSVREALRSLEHAGLLEARAGDGTYIVSSNEMEAILKRHKESYTIDEVYEIRRVFEQLAARLAAKYATDDKVAKIREPLRDRDVADTKQEYVKKDVSFHRAMVRASENNLLIDLYESIDELGSQITEMVEQLDHHFSPQNEELNQKHHDLVDAIADRNEDVAERLAGEIVALARASHTGPRGN